MKLSRVIASSAVGTTFMTLFSHLIAEIEDEDYSEPRLLGKMLHRAVPALDKKLTRIAGWGAHFAVGALFAAPYVYYLNKTGKKPTVVNSIVSGAAGGLAGIAMWKSTFKVHPLPPRIPYNRFYGQLFAAHIVFGVVTAATLHLLDHNKSSNVDDSTEVLPFTQQYV